MFQTNQVIRQHFHGLINRIQIDLQFQRRRIFVAIDELIERTFQSSQIVDRFRQQRAVLFAIRRTRKRLMDRLQPIRVFGCLQTNRLNLFQQCKSIVLQIKLFSDLLNLLFDSIICCVFRLQIGQHRHPTWFHRVGIKVVTAFHDSTKSPPARTNDWHPFFGELIGRVDRWLQVPFGDLLFPPRVLFACGIKQFPFFVQFLKLLFQLTGLFTRLVQQRHRISLGQRHQSLAMFG